ncbi:biotin transporter BioY [Microbacterium sp. 22296]|uniref:biotin transporter BioY n=1 Tax=Microbacterium sp. 22296 TaxID=3453903 RepID=UPI003F83827C
MRTADATDLARIAVFAALIAVLGLPGSFPVFGGVPITAQTLGVMLAGAVLGPWFGALSVTVLLALAAVGLPVLAGGRGGIGVFLGPTAGYALGWILGAIVIGLIVHAGGRRPVVWRTALAMLAGGIGAIYALGIPVQSLVTRLPLAETALTSLVFVPGDLLKAAVATVVATTLVRAYPRGFRREWSAPAPGRRPAEVAVDA